MRVLQVMEATIGGTRRHLSDVCLGLRQHDVDVHVAASSLRVPAFRADLERLREAGCEVVDLPMVRSIRPWTDRAHTARLRELIERVRPDIVHTHSSKAGALGRWAAKRAGVGRTVHTPHTFAFLFDAMFPAWKRRVFRSVETRLATCTDRLVAVSDSEADTIRGSGVVPPDIVRVVPNGIDPEPWLDAQPASGAGSIDRRGIAVPLKAPLAAIVGLLNVAKGQDVAIRALAEPGVEELHLLIVGEGEERSALRDLVQSLGLGDRVHFVGWRDDVPSVLAITDLVAIPSRWEGMPYIALEAMAAGLGIVATRVDGSRDLVVDGETGILCDPEDPPALAAAFARWLALDADGRAALGAAGRARMLREYTADRMVERLLEVYEELL